MKPTTGMPEKLLDSKRASCVSVSISTDAQFLLVHGVPAQGHPVGCANEIPPARFSSRVGAKHPQPFVTSAIVASPIHSRHPNLTVEVLNRVSIALESQPATILNL